MSTGETRQPAGAALERGRMLLFRNRPADAERFLRESLAEDPANAEALYLLAMCVHQDDAREVEGLEILDRAIALEPEWPVLHTRRAVFLAGMKRCKEAHASAEHALTLDPDASDAHAARGLAFLRESRWAEAEEWARRGLALDADDTLAQNVLTQSLLWQGKQEESQDDIRVRLARDPEDAFTHYNAGYAALRQGDSAQAETHFLEALRLNPNFEPAREGLLESFRARNALYRGYLRYAFAMTKLSEKSRLFVIFGVYFVYRLVAGALEKISPLLGSFVVLLYFMFVTWTYLARGIGNFFVLADKKARVALRPREKAEGWAVGGVVAAGLGCVLSGIVMSEATLTLIGICLIGSSIPTALTFSSRSSRAIKLYGACAACTILCAAIVLASLALPGIISSTVGITAMRIGSWTVTGATLLAAFGVWRD